MTLVRALVLLAGIVGLLFVLVRFLEPRLAFFPFPGETTTPRDLGCEYEPLTIETKDGERLRAWLVAPSPGPPSPGTNTPGFGAAGSSPAFVVYFHGNGANLSNWAPIICGVAAQGHSVLAFDYRGYGVSTGTPTEKGLYRDVDAIVDHVWTQVRPSTSLRPGPVIYWGRSLGVSMAAYAATRRQPAGLILESGFPDARSLFRAPSPMALLALFSSYRFPAAEYLGPRRSLGEGGRTVKVPILVMHGDADSVIPYEQGRALYERIEGPKTFFTIRGGDHNDATPRDEASYWQTVRTFIDNL